jgi:hypothetical protein
MYITSTIYVLQILCCRTNLIPEGLFWNNARITDGNKNGKPYTGISFLYGHNEMQICDAV